MSQGEGLAVLQELLNLPNDELASWVLAHVRDLGQPGANIERNAIFKVAGALKGAPSQMKQDLVQHALSGFAEVPPQQKADIIRVVMEGRSAIIRPDTMRLERQQDPSSLNVASSGSRQPIEHHRGENERGNQLLIQNLARLVKEARLNEMPKEDLQGMLKAAEEEAPKLIKSIQPQELVEVISEFDEAEREQLTMVLVEARMVPEEQRAVLQDAVRPGGYVDKLSAVLSFICRFQEHARVFVVLTGIELLLSIILGFMNCGTPLSTWLRWDATLSLLTAGAAYFASHSLAPAYDTLKEDPVGAVQRFQGDVSEDWKTKFETSVPGVSYETCQMGVAGLAVALVFFLGGIAWGAIGILELLATLVLECELVTFAVSMCFVGLRVGYLLAILWGLYCSAFELERRQLLPEPLREPLQKLQNMLPSSLSLKPVNDASDGIEMIPLK